MSQGWCVYDLTIGVGTALDAFTKIANRLGLSNEHVLVEALEDKWFRRFPLGPLESIETLFSGLNEFGFSVASGGDIDDLNAAILSNSASYVSYSRAANRDSITVYSRQQGELRDFADRFMRSVPAKYGFGMDWSRLGSFLGYAEGFSDFKSTGGNLLGTSEAGRWGVLYHQSDPFFDKGYFRSVYPVNLLTTAHLNREAPDGAVRDLILEHRDWGGVTRLAANWFMWWVPLSDLDRVRSEFELRGLVEKI